jgi:hypothetical protein
MTFVSSVQLFVPSEEVTRRLYQVSLVRTPGVYVAPVAPMISVKVVPSELLCHPKEIIPSPIGAEAVSADGVSPSQIVCAPEIAPGTRLLTVTSIGAVYKVQLVPDSVDVTLLLNHVSCASAGESKLSFVAPGIFEYVTLSTLLCHWYVKEPSPEGVILVKAAGISPSHITCAVAIVPGIKFITVTSTSLVSLEQDTPFSEEVTIRLNQVSSESVGDVYVGDVAPGMSVYAVDDERLCHL